MKYIFVKDGRGKRHRVFIDDDGNPHMGFLQEFHSKRSKRAQTLDGRRTSATVYRPPVSTGDAYRWMRDPGASDILGVDAPRQRGQQSILSFNTVGLDDPSILHPAVERPGDVAKYARRYPNASVWEVCPDCDCEVIVPAYRASVCPKCSARVIPCNMCDPAKMDCSRCPYKVKR